MVRDELRTLAMASVFSDPDPILLKKSHRTLAVVDHRGAAGLEVIDVKSIEAVVAMLPFKFALNKVERASAAQCAAAKHRFFVGEKIGLDVAYWAGRIEEDNEGREREEGSGRREEEAEQ